MVVRVVAPPQEESRSSALRARFKPEFRADDAVLKPVGPRPRACDTPRLIVPPEVTGASAVQKWRTAGDQEAPMR